MADSMIINMVKNGMLEFYPVKTLGQAFGNFMYNAEWAVEKDGVDTFVTVSGGILYHDQPAEASVRYIVNTDNEYFEIHAFEIDGVEQGYDLYAELIVGAFEDDLILIVKHGEVYGHSGYFGAALETVFYDIEWETHLDESGNVLVSAECLFVSDGEQWVELLLFGIDTSDETFSFMGYWVDDEEYDFDDFMELVEFAYE